MKKLALACLLFFAVFGLSQSQTITVTSPNGGESWALGSSQVITWTHSGFTGNVAILLMKDGVRVGVIKDGVPVVSGRIDWVAGEYRGGMAVAGTGYKIRIKREGADLMDNSNQPFTLTGLTAREPTPTTARPLITVTTPNGGEMWYTNAAHEVRWTSSGISGSVTIRLKKGGVVVRSWTAENTGSSFGDYSWAQAGTDYKIRLEDSTGSPFDESDRDFTIQVPPGPTPPPPAGKRDTIPAIPAKPIPIFLAVADFKLDNGAETTASTTVTMDHVPRGGPTHYRWRNEAAADWTPWTPYADAHPAGKIPDLCGEHTIHFQVKNDNGESSPVSDSIFYIKDAQQTIPAGCLSDCPCQMARAGWNSYRIIERTWTWREPDDPIGCSNPDGNSNYQTISIRVPSSIVYGQKIVIEFFAGRQLNEGWSFVSIKYRGTEGTYNIRRMPQVGGQDIRFEVSVWSNVGGQDAHFYIDGIVVEGPCNKDVSEAIR